MLFQYRGNYILRLFRSLRTLSLRWNQIVKAEDSKLFDWFFFLLKGMANNTFNLPYFTLFTFPESDHKYFTLSNSNNFLFKTRLNNVHPKEMRKMAKWTSNSSICNILLITLYLSNGSFYNVKKPNQVYLKLY